VTQAALETVAATSADDEVSLGAPDRRRAARWRDGARRTAMVLLAVSLLVAAWELYKAVGPQDGGMLLGTRVLPRANDASMPHVLDVLRTLTEPEVGAAGSRTVGAAVLSAAWFTLQVSIAGALLGTAIGLLLAVAMQRSRIVERGLLPWVLLSQTVPLIALAPLIAGWGGNLSLGPYAWQSWMSVVVVSSYLAFCPVAVGALRGLQSPQPASVELFHSYAAGWWRTLLRLRLPASVPFLVPAFRLAAAAAVVGAIVAEISTGTRGGIGRLILQYAQQATSQPARVYAAVAGAAALGLVASALVTLLDITVLRRGSRAVRA
jgi:NitT/TauT family transport system permease protein